MTTSQPHPEAAETAPATASWNSWVEISRAAYRSNLELFRRLIGANVELSAVVKANAYGHGLREIAGLAIENGADSFCVHALDEALELRAMGFEQDILVMGHVPLRRLSEAVTANLRLVLYNLESARHLALLSLECHKPIRVHLKLETGTYRQGITEDEIPPFLAVFERHPSLVLEGAYTHFADIEDTTSHDYARSQLRTFEQVTEHLERAKGDRILRHTACSAASLLFPQTCFDMIRLGIGQYGLWPSKETFLSYRLEHPDEDPRALQPVMSWKTRVSQVKEVPAGHSIGYGRTYQTTRRSRLAILPIGYSDGYDRRLSNQAHVLIRGQRAPVRGRICMNLTMVDITDIPGVELEEEAVLIGRQSDEVLRASHLADLSGSIAYEIVARVSPALPRLMV